MEEKQDEMIKDFISTLKNINDKIDEIHSSIRASQNCDASFELGVLNEFVSTRIFEYEVQNQDLGLDNLGVEK